MTLRAARPEDAHAIAGITNRIIAETLVTFTTTLRDPADIAREIVERGPAYLVLERDETVQGFCTYGPFRSGPGYAATVELTIQLTPEVQGQGAGRAMLSRLMAVAQQQGRHVMVAGVSSANPGAEAFHRAMGFAETGRMPEVGRKQGQWLDLILMQKVLTAP